MRAPALFFFPIYPKEPPARAPWRTERPVLAWALPVPDRATSTRYPQRVLSAIAEGCYYGGDRGPPQLLASHQAAACRPPTTCSQALTSVA